MGGVDEHVETLDGKGIGKSNEDGRIFGEQVSACG